MAWIGKSRGLFMLHDSDKYCGSFLPVEDAAEILEVESGEIRSLRTSVVDGHTVVDELDLHRAWARGDINSPFKSKIGSATRSLDELIVQKLLQLTLPGAVVESQIPFGRKRADLSFTVDGLTRFIEFVGPSHFIRQYQREPVSPLIRKAEVEDYFQAECVIWPFWIQRCSKNVRAISDQNVDGLASVWSTKALFGDFIFSDAARIIIELSERFNAVKPSGLGYMYGDSHTSKPVHPIIDDIKDGKAKKYRLIPNGSSAPESFWLPEGICDTP